VLLHSSASTNFDTMRLIRVETMVLEEFFGNRIPSYAILSHTWGQNHEEVHFGEMETTSIDQKVGYKKIRYLCQQAAKDGLRWAWCDTCCIDKSSSAELSESINSMFQWYQKANVCYAYVSDVSASGVRQSTMDQMRRSRWFTRGWTLQELLAPEKVFFYDRDWSLLGDKSSLVNYLIDITGVNFGALTWPWALPSYSIATRMSWLSSRTTTRTEDQAYCMLGILGVYMPLLYGEGQNAFRRLQEELIKISDDETIFVHSGPELLAFYPQEFSSGHDLTILKKDKSTPYSITNAGLHIHMRVLKLEVDAENTCDQEVSALGILNCHHNNDTSRNRYLALPLKITGIDSTYRRAPSPLQWVDVDRATSVEYQTIFIQLQAVQISRITLLEDYDLSQYSSQAHPSGSSCVHNQSKREVRIYPRSPFEYEAVLHTFQPNEENESQPFGVVTFFELVNDRAGVFVLPSHSYNRQTLDVGATYSTWKSQGRPTFGELYISGSGKTIKVTVIQKEQMKQFVWILRVEEVKE
jgi:hypothetical protein